MNAKRAFIMKNFSQIRNEILSLIVMISNEIYGKIFLDKFYFI